MEEELYANIKKLVEEYKVAKTGRRKILNKILGDIEVLRKYTNKYNNDLYQIEMQYKLRDFYISDYKLVVNVILKLANQDDKIYGMKEIVATDFVYFNNSDMKQVYGKTLVISREDVLESINENKYFYYDEFAKISSDIVKSGNSIIIVAPNYFEGNVKPRDILSNSLRHDLRNGGFIGNISCFLYDGSLKEAVTKMTDYIELNGPDFEGIDEETLYSLVIENKGAKALSKKINKKI